MHTLYLMGIGLASLLFISYVLYKLFSKEDNGINHKDSKWLNSEERDWTNDVRDFK